MPQVQWKGTGNQATRHRLQQIKWSRRERISAVLIALLAAAVAVISAWLGSDMSN